ncbi:glycosyl hydrolase [Paenibacillus campinasensis]|uniref:Glycosyl hydrolase n=1 Tax=Paenibacillus campinasensis TaxID=66347 RepID=A0ABW9SX04_9BACL|nr:glycosyl hydrolase family 18 protein [Paenibacillus campinasensis]MUG64841.1 glycosyl hydrolase [Paenibacillus campinasensis]
MSKQAIRWAVAAAALAVCILAVVFVIWGGEQRGDAGEPVGSSAASISLSAWVTDWQWEAGAEDLQLLGSQLESVRFFAAYYDASDALHFTPAFAEGLPRVRETAVEAGIHGMLLTIVNDYFHDGGVIVQKDPGLVSRLISSEESRSRHIEEIAATAVRYGFSGVEIDYEKVQPTDWSRLSRFYKELYERLRKEGLSLRVVLEPGADLDAMRLPEGSSYVMMAYNLYGGHSGPGPKADHELIRKLAGKLNGLPGEHELALATGGFAWSEDGSVVAVTEKRAGELAELSADDPKRDPDSGALFFEYNDEQGAKHTVWYADGITLAGWIKQAEAAGISDIVLWRLGELDPETLRILAEESSGWHEAGDEGM